MTAMPIAAHTAPRMTNCIGSPVKVRDSAVTEYVITRPYPMSSSVAMRRYGST